MPVWGSVRQSSAAFDRGEYLNGVGLYGMAFFEAFTFGIGSEYTAAAKAEMAASLPKRVYTAIPAEQGGGFTSKLVAEKVAATGQIHHLLTNKIINALERHPALNGSFIRTDTRFIYNASDAAAHRGYQTWHRQYDKMVVDYIESNPNLPVQPDI